VTSNVCHHVARWLKQIFVAPSLLPGAEVRPYTGVRDLEGANPSTAFIIENPCNRKEEIFSEEDGPVRSIDVIVKEVRANPNQGNRSELS